MENKYYMTENEAGDIVIGIRGSMVQLENVAQIVSQLNDMDGIIKRQAEWIEANKNKAKNAARRQNEQGKQIQAMKQSIKDLRKYPDSLRKKIPQVLMNSFEELGTYDTVMEDGTYVLSIGSADLERILDSIKHVR